MSETIWSKNLRARPGSDVNVDYEPLLPEGQCADVTHVPTILERNASEAARHNVTKPHRPRTYRDAGLERTSGGAHVKLEQAPQGATGRGLGWSRGPQEDRGRITISGRSRRHRTGGANHFLSIVTAHQRVQSIDCSRYYPLAVEQRRRIRRYKKGFANTAVDPTETIKVDGE